MYLVIALFIGTLLMFALMGYMLNRMSSEGEDRTKGLSGNQIRLLAWLVVIIAGLIGAVIEFNIVFR